MANVDRRVRVLTNVLMEHGFSWLAAEIIDTIETGRSTTDDRDHNVDSHRAQLNAALVTKFSSAESAIQHIEDSSADEQDNRVELSPSEQIRTAVDTVVIRLSTIGEMFDESISNLEDVFGSDARLAIEFNGEVRQVDRSALTHASRRLRTLREQLIQWLETET